MWSSKLEEYKTLILSGFDAISNRKLMIERVHKQYKITPSIKPINSGLYGLGIPRV